MITLVQTSNDSAEVCAFNLLIAFVGIMARLTRRRLLAKA